MYSVAAVFVGLLIVETVADEQHFRFQTYKHSLSVEERAESIDLDVKRGFYTLGASNITNFRGIHYLIILYRSLCIL